MKNFSAKTADFDSISISGEAPIVQSDLGTAPNQIPLNKDLGTLAYMDSSGVEDVNADTIELREIAAELSETAVDVFVYDTRKDSDGGAWRSRTSHTSWYNEELNTATRGGRREFPAVAVIVAEADKVTIYDGDDPDLSMWMVFNQGGSAAATANLIGPTQATSTSVFMLNGVILVTENAWGAGLISANFISEGFIHYWQASKKYNGNISQRNDSMGYSTGYNEVIVDGSGNDVAMTVLPNAPIDDNTGLPVPTIAVATDGGVSVIKDDGSVVDITSSQAINALMIYDNENKLLLRENGSACSYGPLNISSDLDIWTEWREGYFNNSNTMPATLPQINIGLHSDSKNELGVPSSEGLTLIDVDKSNPSISNGCYISSSYNTGWMPGDIKLATLSDTKVEKVGEDESTELINLNDGDTDGGSWAVDSNTQVSASTTSDATSYYRTGLTTQVGKKYTATLTITNYTGSGDLGVGALVSGEITQNLRLSANGTITIQFNGSNEEISLFYRSTNTATMQLSIKQTGELITNGTFDNGTEGWIADRGTISENNSVLQLSQTTGDNAYAYQDIDGFIVGKKYVISFELRGVDTSANMFGMVKDLVSNTELISREYVSSGFNGPFVKKSHSFVASSGSLRVFFMINTSTDNLSLEVDNISVRLAEDDRSVNDNGLQIFGEIDKTPVATGADLVAYSGFSAENYLMQPYNSDLDFGIGDFCVMGWAKTTSTENQRIFSRNLDSNNRLIVYTINGRMSFYTQQDGDTSWIQSVPEIDHGSWFNFCCSRRSGVIEVYVDGKKQNNASSSNIDIIRDIDFGQVDSWIGNSPNNTDRYFRGSIALLRISATVPTPEQIAKIYRDEKPLFQDGAQATLYGTSDAVTALAYDDSENLLHVGTASGRSSFNGLKRVENTDVAVTTAISATEGLVIEQ